MGAQLVGGIILLGIDRLFRPLHTHLLSGPFPARPRSPICTRVQLIIPRMGNGRLILCYTVVCHCPRLLLRFYGVFIVTVRTYIAVTKQWQIRQIIILMCSLQNNLANLCKIPLFFSKMNEIQHTY